jgi:3-oxoacyl-[acyl-carrier-protein] synthase-1
LGATSVHEAIYSLSMMQNSFISASANVQDLDPALDAGEIVTKRQDNVEIDTVLSNSFGFGGTNATLILSKFNG